MNNNLASFIIEWDEAMEWSSMKDLWKKIRSEKTSEISPALNLST